MPFGRKSKDALMSALIFFEEEADLMERAILGLKALGEGIKALLAFIELFRIMFP